MLIPLLLPMALGLGCSKEEATSPHVPVPAKAVPAGSTGDSVATSHEGIAHETLLALKFHHDS